MTDFMSHSALRVVKHLDAFGITLDLQDRFYLELDLIKYYPTQIMGVIDKVLSGKTAFKKMMRAQDQGWGYFHMPVCSLLEARPAAHQKHRPDKDEPEDIEASFGTYSMVVRTFMANNFNYREREILVLDMPTVCTELSLLDGIRKAKEQGVRSIPYLMAILERERARKFANLEDSRKNSVEPFTPPPRDEIEIEKELERWEKMWEIDQRARKVMEGKRGKAT